MKLIHTHKKGTQTFELIDGRHVKSYPSGYVRMSKQISAGTRMGKPFIDYNNTHYQLNRVDRIPIWNKYYKEYSTGYKRILIPCIWERMEFIKQWELRNCKLTRNQIECGIEANEVYNNISTNFQVRY